MSHSFGRIFGVGALVSLALAACADHRPVGPLRDGDAACQDLVAQCQEPSALGEPYRSCYDTGIRGDGDVCLSTHDDCIKSCNNVPASAGGAGGESGRGEAGASNTAGGPSGNAGGGGVSATGGASGGAAEIGGTGAVTAAGGAAEAGHAGN